MSWTTRWRDWIVPRPPKDPLQPLEPGLYHFMKDVDGRPIRYHLRVAEDGRGWLLAGASEAVRLSPAGAVMVLALLEGNHPRDIAEVLHLEKSDTTLDEVQELLDQIGRPSARYPVFNLADPLASPTAATLPEPFQADVQTAGDAPMIDIVDRLWERGIPHARFWYEGDGRDQSLVPVIEHAEDLGMITGLRCSPQHCSEKTLEDLANVGLDYVVLPVVLTEESGEVPDAEELRTLVDQIRRREMTPVIECAVTDPAVESLDEIVERLLSMGIENVEMFAVACREELATPGCVPAPALRQLAAWVEDLADEHALQIVWLPPVAGASDTAVECARRGPRSSGDLAIRVHADGTVLLPRGPEQSPGNLLRDPWSAIWNHAMTRDFRQRAAAETHCALCPKLAICASACPAVAEGFAWQGTTTPRPGKQETEA